MIIQPGYWQTNYWADRFWIDDYWPEFQEIQVSIHPSRRQVLSQWVPPVYAASAFIPVFLHKNKAPIMLPVGNVSAIEGKSPDQMTQHEFEMWRRIEGAKHH